MSENNTVSKPPFDPGWNDPPKMGYEEQAKPSPNRSKLNLTKRVAFPIGGPGGGGAGQKVELAPSGLPMPFARVSSKAEPSGIIPPSSSSSDIKPPPTMGDNPASGSVQVIHAVQGTAQEAISDEKMREILRDFERFSKKIEDKKVEEEVSRRLDILGVQSRKNELSEAVKSRLVKICEALKEENYTEASQIHRSLMVDFHSTCCSWGSSLRNIILAAQPQDEIQDKHQEEPIKSEE
ncbi:steroid receptor RNA activator 1-like [Phlebotomus argentipes]|uniref:steroid receptor RNA activator 1-like n=1 Tax=Phlebotomus argentipes TaxID=94469 RepID=UPI002892A1FD|nr:steroid receptor RNA activator 1-like [Phlebotomus argentipes]